MEALQQLSECCLFTNTNLRVSHVKSIHYHHSTGGRGEGGRTRNEIHRHICLPPTRASPEKIFMLYYMHVYTYVTYVRFYLSRDERKAYMTGNPTGPKRMLTPVPLTQNPPPKSTGFGPGPKASASQWSSAPKRPNALLRPPRPPPLPPFISAFPWDTEAHSSKERSVRPQGGS